MSRRRMTMLPPGPHGPSMILRIDPNAATGPHQGRFRAARIQSSARSEQRVFSAARGSEQRVGEAFHSFDRLRRATPRRDDHARHTDLFPPLCVVARRDGTAEYELERGRLTTVFGEQRAQHRNLSRAGFERMPHTDPPVTETRRAPQRCLRFAADENRGPRTLHRLRFEHHLVEAEELAVMRDRFFGKESFAHLDRFVDAPTARREIELGGVPLLFEPRRADAELEAPAAQEVDGLYAARGRERVPEPDVVDVGSEPDAFGARREIAE